MHLPLRWSGHSAYLFLHTPPKSWPIKIVTSSKPSSSITCSHSWKKFSTGQQTRKQSVPFLKNRVKSSFFIRKYCAFIKTIQWGKIWYHGWIRQKNSLRRKQHICEIGACIPILGWRKSHSRWEESSWDGRKALLSGAAGYTSLEWILPHCRANGSTFHNHWDPSSNKRSSKRLPHARGRHCYWFLGLESTP